MQTVDNHRSRHCEVGVEPGPAPEGPKVEWSAPVDVKAVLRELAKSKKQKLNYDKSIVDLLLTGETSTERSKSNGGASSQQEDDGRGKSSGLSVEERLTDPQGGTHRARPPFGLRKYFHSRQAPQPGLPKLGSLRAASPPLGMGFVADFLAQMNLVASMLSQSRWAT